MRTARRPANTDPEQVISQPPALAVGGFFVNYGAMTPSAHRLWNRYRALYPDAPEKPDGCFHFCDNPQDADECADLVVRDIKRATAASVAELELADMRQPAASDLSIITRWDGEAVAVIQTTRVELRRFDDIDEAFARCEGEGDQTLSWWRTAHEAYYRRVLSGSGMAVDGNLLIVCEYFERVFPVPDRK